MSLRKKIVIASNRTAVRKTLQRLFSEELGWEVVVESKRHERLAALAAESNPEAIILDVSRSCFDSMDLCRVILKYSPKTGVVILSSGSAEAYIFRLVDGEDRITARREKGFSRIVTALRELCMNAGHDGPPRSASHAKPSEIQLPQPSVISLPRMTAREREVFQLVAKGHTSAEIARELGISVRTVEAHRNNLHKKLEGPAYIALIQSAIGSRLRRRAR